MKFLYFLFLKVKVINLMSIDCIVVEIYYVTLYYIFLLSVHDPDNRMQTETRFKRKSQTFTNWLFPFFFKKKKSTPVSWRHSCLCCASLSLSLPRARSRSLSPRETKCGVRERPQEAKSEKPEKGEKWGDWIQNNRRNNNSPRRRLKILEKEEK